MIKLDTIRHSVLTEEQIELLKFGARAVGDFIVLTMDLGFSIEIIYSEEELKEVFEGAVKQGTIH